MQFFVNFQERPENRKTALTVGIRYHVVVSRSWGDMVVQSDQWPDYDEEGTNSSGTPTAISFRYPRVPPHNPQILLLLRRCRRVPTFASAR